MEEIYGNIINNVVLMDTDGAIGFSQDSDMRKDEVEEIRKELSVEWATYMAECMRTQDNSIFSALSTVIDGSSADEGLEYEV
jgi:hypothetical protein